MKKSLIALAALAVVGAASAQSTVTLYGLIDMNVSSLKDANGFGFASGGVAANGTVTKNGVFDGVSTGLNGSRIGFKGTEDLGGGLKANFVLEYKIQPADGAASTTMANRQSFVGLSGNFGAVTIGRQYSPYYTTQGALDQVGNVAAPGYVVNNHIRGGGRNSNAIQYVSPTISGFTGTVQVGAGDQVATGDTSPTATPSTTGKNYGLAGVYAAGPLVAGFAYDAVSKPGATAPVGFSGLTGTSAANALVYGIGAGADDVKTWAAGASYDFTVAKASLAYSNLTATTAGVADTKSAGWNLSAGMPLGAASVSANIGRATVSQDGNPADVTIKGYQLRADYSLSKRTTVYALYGAETASIDTVAGDFKKTQVTTGVRHTF